MALIFSQRQQRRIAARAAVDDWINARTQVVAIGAGNSITDVVEYVAESVQKNSFFHIIFIPTSPQSRDLIIQYKLRWGTFDLHPNIDVLIDGCNEVDENMVVIKGYQGCLLNERIVAYFAKSYVLVADNGKYSKRLGEQFTKGIPIQVVQSSYMAVQRLIEAQFGDEVILRLAVDKRGPMITDNGNVMLQWKFDCRREFDWQEVYEGILQIPGVVTVGILVNMVKKVYFGMEDGTVRTRTAK